MASPGTFALALLQLPGVQAPDVGFWERAGQLWENTGFMRWPLALVAVIALIIIIWKLIDLSIISRKTGDVLDEVDRRLADHDVAGALQVARESDTPAGRIITAGLERRDEGTDRVMKAIENVGLIEMAGLERGLVWLATAANVGPLLGFLGTVIGMIAAFQAIELAGEVDATVVAGGIKIALLTTAAGLAIAIPVNIMHNYFVTKVDRLVIDMEESAQNMVDTLHEVEAART